LSELAKAQRAAAEKKLEDICGAADDAWEGLKDDAEKTWKAVRNSVNFFKSHFK
jgi:hypothetical protein